MTLRGAQKHNRASEHKLFYYISFTLLEGIEKIKTEEMGKKVRRKERGMVVVGQ